MFKLTNRGKVSNTYFHQRQIITICRRAHALDSIDFKSHAIINKLNVRVLLPIFTNWEHLFPINICGTKKKTLNEKHWNRHLIIYKFNSNKYPWCLLNNVYVCSLFICVYSSEVAKLNLWKMAMLSKMQTNIKRLKWNKCVFFSPLAWTESSKLILRCVVPWCQTHCFSIFVSVNVKLDLNWCSCLFGWFFFLSSPTNPVFACVSF